MRLYLKGCRRCSGGDLFREYDTWTRTMEVVCLQCGWRVAERELRYPKPKGYTKEPWESAKHRRNGHSRIREPRLAEA